MSVYFNTYVFTSSWSHHWASRSRGWGDRTLPSDLALAGATFKWWSSVGNIVYLLGGGVKGVKLLALEYKTISSRIYYLFRRNHRPYFLTHSPFLIHCSEPLDLTILTAHTFIIHCFDQLDLPILTKTTLFLICSSVWSQTLRHSISRFLNRVFSQSDLFSIGSFLNRVFSQSGLFSIGSFLNRVFSQLNLFGVATAN